MYCHSTLHCSLIPLMHWQWMREEEKAEGWFYMEKGHFAFNDHTSRNPARNLVNFFSNFKMNELSQRWKSIKIIRVYFFQTRAAASYWGAPTPFQFKKNIYISYFMDWIYKKTTGLVKCSNFKSGLKTSLFATFYTKKKGYLTFNTSILSYLFWRSLSVTQNW